MKTGYLDSPSHGIWRLTDKGKEAHLDGPDIDTIVRRVAEMSGLAKAGAETKIAAEPLPENKFPTKDKDDEAIAPSPQTSPYSDHRPALISLIGSMHPSGFEEFCSELLSRVGVEDVQTTRYSKDAGIDGTGRLRINEFVSQPIAFQSKKSTDRGERYRLKRYNDFEEPLAAILLKEFFLRQQRFPRMRGAKQGPLERSKSSLSTWIVYWKFARLLKSDS